MRFSPQKSLKSLSKCKSKMHENKDPLSARHRVDFLTRVGSFYLPAPAGNGGSGSGAHLPEVVG